MSKGPSIFRGRHRHHGHHHLINTHLIKDVVVGALAIKGATSTVKDLTEKKDK